ncbi:MAG TPA: M28 family peptidase [Pyrinomonadaceae bacterium]|jgi:glutaminyl-peptide cyclotransferase|nr:M28 family peptidase [Pyrinomonadaceae bacterium]
MGRRSGTQNRIGQLATVLLMPLLFAACPKDDPPPRPKASISTSTRPVTPSPTVVAAFNGERAMDHVRKQIDFGPRPPDTEQLAKTRAYITNELKSYGLNVSLDEFKATTPQGEKKMANIVAEISGESKTLILITSHYDTKFYKDMYFVGANDPAASVATLLEIGRVLGSNKQKPKATYRLVFFDGEEAFCEGWSDCGEGDNPDNTYGSRHYVSQLRVGNELAHTKAMILLDMMGYKNLELGRDPISTKWLQDIIWQTGRELGFQKVFVDREEGVGGDDHEPFLRAGVDSVDIIQLSSYPHWHKADDTVDKISQQSMKVVGDTILASLPKIAERVTKEKKE